MIENDFTISGTWACRREDSGDVAQRFLRSLDILSAINPHFSSWQVGDPDAYRDLELEDMRDLMEAGEQLPQGELALEDVRNRFSEIVERGGQIDVQGNPLPHLGYSVSAWNGGANAVAGPFSVSLRVEAGGGPTAYPSIVFSTDYTQVPDPSIVTYPMFRAALLALAEIWDVAYAQAFSSDLSEEWEYPRLDFELAWMTYLSPLLATKIIPPSGIMVEQIKDGGLLLIAAEKTFDVGDPRQMQAAQIIRDALAPLNNLQAHEQSKQKKLGDYQELKTAGFRGELVHGRRNPPKGY